MATNSGSSISAFISSLKFIKKQRIECDHDKLHVYHPLSAKPINSPLTTRRRSFSSGNLSDDIFALQNGCSKCNNETEKKVTSSSKLRRKSFNRRYFSSNSNINETLYNAVINENIDLVKHYSISEGVNINHLRPSGWTVFHHACRIGNIEVVDILLNAGANIKILAPGGITPLKMAVMHGNFEVADYLISEKGVSCDEIRDGFQELKTLKYSSVNHERTHSR